MIKLRRAEVKELFGLLNGTIYWTKKRPWIRDIFPIANQFL
jgi:hypothetical protein